MSIEPRVEDAARMLVGCVLGLDHRTAKRRTEIAEGRLSHVVYRSKGSAGAVWPATIDAPMIRFAQVHRTLTTRSHEKLITPREWRRSIMFNEYFRPSHIDDRLLTVCKLPDGGGDRPTGEHGVSLYRATGERPFTERDRRLVHLAFEELRLFVGTKLDTCRGRELRALSPRLKQVLDLLLLGYSDKEIAARCDLARPTAREYITTIYRRYGASSRAHLLALFLRWQRDGPAK